MAVLLLDATVWLAAKDEADEAHEACRAVVATISHDLAALDLTLYETANVAVTRWRDVTAAIELGGVIRVAVGDRLLRMDTSLHASAATLAAAHGLTVYDAAYVAARDASDYALISLDQDLLTPGFAIHPRDVPPDPPADDETTA